MTADQTQQLNLRLDDELIQAIQHAADEEALDRATMVRRLLHEGLVRWRIDRAIVGYQRGRISIGRAAEDAEVTQWELMDELHSRNIAHPLRASEVEEWSRTDDGFRITIEWLGQQVTTLVDVPPQEGCILLVGISPKDESIHAGHYYQGRLGKRLWRRLERAGLLSNAVPGKEDEAFRRLGHGLTDIIKRPLEDSDRPTRDELQRAVAQFRSKVRLWRPGLILFAFKQAAEAVLEEPLTPGPGPSLEGCLTFLLPSPYAERSVADARYDDLVEAWETRFHVFNEDRAGMDTSPSLNG